MNGLFFDLDPYTQTIVVFTIVLLSLSLAPMSYVFCGDRRLGAIHKRSLWLDWRFLLPLFIYSIFLGLRYNYSFDWMQYKNTFNYLRQGLLFRDTTEQGYLFVNKILIYLGFNFYSIFIVEGIFYLFAFYYLFKDYRKYIPFVLPLVYMANYSNSLNISRQYFAMSLVLIAYRCLLDGRKLIYLLLAVVAAQIHSSAYLWIVPFWLLKDINKFSRHINFLYMFVLYVIVAIVSYAYRDYIYGFLSQLANLFTAKDYNSDHIMADRFMGEEMPVFRMVRVLFKSLVLLYLYREQNKAGWFSRHPILHNFVLIGIATIPISIVMGTHEIFSRTIYYITLFIDIATGIVAANLILNIRRYNPITITMTILCFAHYFYQFYSSIIAGFTNINANFCILYRV